jgi:RND family efflux transporter MFP subunit
MNQIFADPPSAKTDNRSESLPPGADAPDHEDRCLARARTRAAKRLGIGTVAALALMVGWGVWIHAARNAAAQDALETRQNAIPVVRTMEVKTITSPRIVDLPGTMQAFDAATLYARATGYIAKRNVDIGSKVHEGDVLAVIAAPDLDQQLAQARAQLAQMQASLAQAEAGRSLADVTNRRTSRLVVEGWSSRQQGDTDRTNFASQTAAVRVAEANVAAQQAQVNRLAELTGFERVTAPFSGVITARQIDTGSLVTADQTGGTPLFSIARTDVLRVQIYVPQADVFGLHDGQDATITVPQLPGHVFHGTVARNAGALDTGTRTLLVEVDVNNQDAALSAGLYGIVHLQQARSAPVVLVPSEAVIFDKDGLSVAVVDDGHAVIRHLDILADDGAQLEVRAGLQPGDRVILNPPANLVGGMKVKA